MDLKLAGVALQAKWLWLKKTDADRSLAALDITTTPEVQAFFQASVTANLGDGLKIKFWTDNWIEGSSLLNIAPNLLRLVPPRHRKNRTVAEALIDERWTRDVTGTLNEQAITEIQLLGTWLQGVQLTELPDSFAWKWTANGQYSARSAYGALQRGRTAMHGAQLIWKTWAPLKVKLFLWLTFHKRHWTADRRIRHGLQASPTCRLCDQEDETMEHIVFQCSYSRQVWWLILQNLGAFNLQIGEQMTVQRWWIHLRSQLPGAKCKGFDTLFALVAWQLWKERNARVFRGVELQPNFLLRSIKQEGENWISAGAAHLGCLFSE